MNHDIINGTVILVTLGAVAQWIAWRWRIPAQPRTERFGVDAVPLVELDEEGNVSFVRKDQPIRGPGELLCLSP